ncbi:MAG: AI-2E family transporter [Halolamina sp.]
MNLDRGFLLALVALLLVLTGMIVRPFLQYVLGAVLLAYVLYPAQVRLEADRSPTVVALGLVGLSVAGVILPFVAILAEVVQKADSVLENVDAGATPIVALEARIQALTGFEVDIVQEVVGAGREFGTAVLERSTAVVGTVAFHLLGVTLALFLLYYLLKDGERLLAWLDRTVPLPTDQREELYAGIDDVMWGVIVGHVFVGAVQGIVAGVGLFLTGVPNPLFWTAIMVVLAMVPLVGTIPVWGGAVGYLALTDQPLFAVGLFVYSVVVVGLTDDYLRPFAVDRYAQLNPAVVILGVLGGAYTFGVMGLFFGPVVLGALKTALNVLTEGRTRGDWDERG